MALPRKSPFSWRLLGDLDLGRPNLGKYTRLEGEGFIFALLESFTGKPFRVKEVDCWCTGDRTCRFTAKVIAA